MHRRRRVEIYRAILCAREFRAGDSEEIDKTIPESNDPTLRDNSGTVECSVGKKDPGN